MFNCEFDTGFQKKEKGKFEINPMKKQRFIIWVSLLIAIFDRSRWVAGPRVLLRGEPVL